MPVQRFSVSLEETHVQAIERHIHRIGLDGKDSAFSLALQSVITLYDREQSEVEQAATRGRTPAKIAAQPTAPLAA